MLIPERNYLAPTSKSYRPDRWHTWLGNNEKIRPLAAEVDVVFPSLYTFKTDQAGWLEYARTNIAEARQYGKPVIALLWPQYHNTEPKIGSTYIPESFWKLQLETLHKLTDGAIIWGSRASASHSSGWDKWNSNAAWWKATKAFADQKTKMSVTSACKA